MPESLNTAFFTLENRSDDLERVMDEVEALLERRSVPPKRKYAVRLALDELLSNIIKYAYEDDDLRRIRLRLDFEDPMSLTLEDDGRPFNPLVDAPAPVLDGPVEDRPIGGLGLHLIQSMGMQLDYRRENECNRLRVGFPVDS